MTIIASPLATSQDAIPIVSPTQIGKFAGLHMHFPSLAAFQSAVGTEQANVSAASAMWTDKQVMTVSGEPTSAYRIWQTSVSNARLVHIRPGLTVLLAGDTNTVLSAAGIPGSGTGNNGDISIDFAGNKIYLKTAGAWALSLAAIYPSDANKVSFAAPWAALGNVVTGVPGLTTLSNASPGTQTSFQNTSTGSTTVNYLGTGITAVLQYDIVEWNPLSGVWTLQPFAQRVDASPDYAVNVTSPIAAAAAAAAAAVQPAVTLTAVTYDSSNRVTGFTLNGVAFVVAYVSSTSTTVTGGGKTKTITLDSSGRISGLAVA